MKRVLLFIITCIVCSLEVSCTDWIETEVSHTQKAIRDTPILTRSESIIEYMGHKYAITNGPLTIEEARIKLKDTSLVPTHYALRIVPDSMDQLHTLEADKSLIIQYFPFGYKLLPDPSDWIIEEKGFEPVRNVFYDEFNATFEQNSDSREVCPVYVLWPVSIPLPQNMQYDLLFDVYQPWEEYSKGQIPDPQPIPSISGYLRSYDNRLNQYMPLGHVKVDCQILLMR